MICYSCNKYVGVQWVKVCPYCGNEQIEAQNLEMRKKIDRFFSATDEIDAGSEHDRP
jgi:predicted RNA-binding Zn-ribbon protein involved in translation (DUF1610 family)